MGIIKFKSVQKCTLSAPSVVIFCTERRQKWRRALVIYGWAGPREPECRGYGKTDLRENVRAFFDPDGTFVFGNAAPVVGRAAIEAAVTNFFRVLKGLRHELHDVWQAGDVVISRLTVTYIRLDGTTVTLPAATIWHGQRGVITDYRIYADLGPLLTHAA